MISAHRDNVWRLRESVRTTLARRIPGLRRLDVQTREVVEGTAVAFTFKVLGIGLGFAFNLLLAHSLGAEGVGVYYLALTVTGISAVLGRLGLDQALLRFTAANAERGDWTHVAGVYRRGLLLAGAASAAVTVLIISTASWIAQAVFSEPALDQPLRLMAIGIVPMSLVSLHGALLKGLRRIRDAMLVESIVVPLVGLPLLLALARDLGVAGAVIAYVASNMVALLLGVALWRRATPQLKGLSASFDTRYLLAASLPLFWIAVMNLAMDRIDMILLGTWTNSEWVGIYGVARRTAGLTVFILVAVNSVVAPRFASLYAQNDLSTLGTLARNAAAIMALFASPIVLLFVLFPSWVMGLFGPEFALGAPILAVLAIGQFVNVATGSVGLLLIMTGHEKLMRNNIIAVTFLSVGLYVALIPAHGALGAALAKAIGLALMNLISVGLVYWKLSIFTLPLPRRLFVHEK